MDEVEEVKSKVDIVAVIGERLDLKRAGRNFKAPCPFHSEKTPSFMVSPELQVYKCFGCGASGDVFSFLMQYEGMEFPEALKALAVRAGVTLKPRVGKDEGVKEKLYKINDFAAKFYHYVLLKHPAGEPGRKYLREERKISDQALETFDLGFAPDSQRLLSGFLSKKKEIQAADMEMAGLIVGSGGRFFDRFRGRVIFPLFDHRGNAVGLAGRILPEIEKKMTKGSVGKYINSPETPVYHKGSLLFGLSVTRADIKREGFAVLVEGELDAISSWQAGIKNVVAIKGSALTEDQARVLARLCERIVLALDTDFAGNEAAKRGIFIAERAGLEVHVAELGEYKDPDDAARSDPEFLKKQISNSVGVWDFLISMYTSRENLTTGSGKAKVSRELIPLIAQIGNAIVQDHYAGVLAGLLGVSPDVVRSEIEKVQKSVNVGRGVEWVNRSEVEESAPKGQGDVVEEEILKTIMTLNPKLLDERIINLIKNPAYKRIAQEIQATVQVGKFDAAKFARELPAEFVPKFLSIMLNPEDKDETPEELEKELTKLCERRSELLVKDERVKLTEELIKSEALGEKMKASEVEKRISELDETRKKISNEV